MITIAPLWRDLASSGLVPAAEIEEPKSPTFNFEKENNEPVVINGDTVEYSEEGKTAIANGNVVITYQDIKLTCKKAVFHADTKEVSAEGDVKLTQGKNLLNGEHIIYNVETKGGGREEKKKKKKKKKGEKKEGKKINTLSLHI